MANGPVTEYDFDFPEWSEGATFGGASNIVSPEDFGGYMEGLGEGQYHGLIHPSAVAPGYANMPIDYTQSQFGLLKTSDEYASMDPEAQKFYTERAYDIDKGALEGQYSDYTGAYEAAYSAKEKEWETQTGLFELYGMDPKTNKPYTEESYGLHQQGLETQENERLANIEAKRLEDERIENDKIAAESLDNEEDNTEDGIDQADPGETIELSPPDDDPVTPSDVDETTPTNEVSDKEDDDPWLKFATLVTKFGATQKGKGFKYKGLSEMRGGRRGPN